MYICICNLDFYTVFVGFWRLTAEKIEKIQKSNSKSPKPENLVQIYHPATTRTAKFGQIWRHCVEFLLMAVSKLAACLSKSQLRFDLFYLRAGGKK